MSSLCVCRPSVRNGALAKRISELTYLLKSSNKKLKLKSVPMINEVFSL